MRIEQLGEGTPAVAIVGAIHGDEPEGVRAIDRLLSEDPPVDRPVKLIVANEEALESGVRYLDADLNRAFEDGTRGHERDLAERLAAEIEGCVALSLHSTQSSADPFGLAAHRNRPVSSICQALPLSALVLIDEFDGRPFALTATEIIEVETGLQGTDRAGENAYDIARAFLAATGVLSAATDRRSLPLFRLGDRIEKPLADSYEVLVPNFERVEAGEVFAVADGRELIAERAFYPILVSSNGYEDQFGYAGDRIGILEA